MSAQQPADAASTSPALADHVDAARDYYERAEAANTRLAYEAGWRDFACFCQAHGQSPWPATPEAVAIYATSLARSHPVTTVRARLAAIGACHRAGQVEDPTRHEAVRRILRGIAREHGQRPRQARGLTESDVARIRGALEGSLLDQRDLALLLVGRDLLARRSELVALDIADLTLGDDDGFALIRRSKTDPEGEGSTGYLGPETVAALRGYLHAANIATGAVFRQLGKGGTVRGRLSDKGVGRAYKRIAARAGITPSEISGHSARVGMTQDLARFGASTPELQTAGRWRDPKMPARYAEKQQARRSVVARFHSLQ